MSMVLFHCAFKEFGRFFFQRHASGKVRNMILDYETYRKVKDGLLEEGNREIHMHDTCSGQYFSIDGPDDATRKSLETRLAALGACPVYNDERNEFKLQDLEPSSGGGGAR